MSGLPIVTVERGATALAVECAAATGEARRWEEGWGRSVSGGQSAKGTH